MAKKDIYLSWNEHGNLQEMLAVISIGSSSYTVSGSRGLSTYSVGFTLSNTSLQIKFCHCYR